MERDKAFELAEEMSDTLRDAAREMINASTAELSYSVEYHKNHITFENYQDDEPSQTFRKVMYGILFREDLMWAMQIACTNNGGLIVKVRLPLDDELIETSDD